VGLYYQDFTANPIQCALITSISDFNNSGQKVWDTFEVTHSALNPTYGAVGLDYALGPSAIVSPGWTLLFDNTTDNSVGNTFVSTANLKARSILLRIRISGNNPAAKTDFTSFSARSNPSPVTQEYVLQRSFRILASDRKDELATEVFCKPDVVRVALEGMTNKWVTFREPNRTWTAFVVGAVDITPMVPSVRVSGGDDPDRKAYVIQLQMLGH
jgi:hypothetical protein